MKQVTILIAAFTCLMFGKAFADESDLSQFDLQDNERLEMLAPGAGFSSSDKSKKAFDRIKNVPWLALFDGKRGRLQRRSIRIKRLKQDAEGYGPDFSAEVIGAGPMPLMLLQPFPGLHAGPVKRFLSLTSLNDITEDRPLQVHGATKVVLEHASGVISSAPGAATSSCQLVLISDKGRQILDHPSCTEVDGKLTIAFTELSIEWAGDLDHDGKPDFIFARGGEISFYLLALSSAAGENELLRVVEVYEVPDWC